MIQYWIRDRLKEAAPNVRWTVDVSPDVPTSATVFFEGGAEPFRYDFQFEYPSYMIWVESTDLGMAEYLARLVYLTLHNYHLAHPFEPIDVTYYTDTGEELGQESFVLQKITALSPPNPIGMDGKKMQYSVNFESTIERKGTPQ